jgi:tRNA(Ile)-lysidine synthase TilS/MesJ
MNTAHVFEKWKLLNNEHLKKCRGKHVVATFSAGKDSSVCLYFLNKAKEEYGYDLSGVLYAFPKHRYTEGYRERLLPFWNNLGLEIECRESPVDDTILEEGENPCRPCQNLRKKDLPKLFDFLSRPPGEVVIVSGHSLWDLAGYALDRFVADKLSSSTNYAESFSKDRFLEISQRFYPFLSMKGGYSVYRPMLFLNVEEITMVCGEISLPVLETPCRYSQQRPKKKLGGYFQTFGYQFEYGQVLAFAKEYLDIAELEEIENISPEEFLTRRF